MPQTLIGRLILFLLAAALFGGGPGRAQSLLRDAETEAFFVDLALPLARAAELDPRSTQVLLVGDPSINAGAGGGQNVFINSGLIVATDNVNQLQGVLAHELGHLAGGHNVRAGEGTQGATGISVLSLVLGAAAIAAGAGEAGTAILAGGQQAALGKYLAFSQEQESRTDQAGALFLERAGVSGRGAIEFFRKLQNQEYRLGLSTDDGYGRTHPLTGDRIAALETRLQASPSWNKRADPALERRFQRIRAKLIGYVEEPARTFQLYPESDGSEYAHYARAYAWHKLAFLDKAMAETDALLERAPHDPYYLELRGQILLESGKVQESIPPLREAVQNSRNQPLIAALLGHALLSTEDPANLDEAKRLLKGAVVRDNRNPFAWYQLGIAYSQEGDDARAALASAERFSLEGALPQALVSGERALQGLPRGTPDWLRAQDIVMVARNEANRAGRRERSRFGPAPSAPATGPAFPAAAP